MVRMILGVIVGFFAWMIVWFGSERIIAVVWPEFGSHQAAFQSAIENGGPFTADSTILLVHILLASIVSVISGCVTAIIAGENRRAPLILGFLMLSLGLVKAAMSWDLVPSWYHVGFAAVLFLMTFLGGKLKSVK